MIKRVLRAVTPPFLWEVAHKLKVLVVPQPPPKWAIDLSWPQQPIQWVRYTPRGLPSGPVRPATIDNENLQPGQITAAQVSDAARAFSLAFAFVIAKVSRTRQVISVFDFGGAVGGHHRIARNAIPDCRISYTIEELPELCAYGRVARPDIKFITDPAEADSRYDLIFASGALQYVENWRAMLTRFAKMADPWVYVTRLLVFEGPTRLLREDGSITLWGISRAEFLEAAKSNGLVLVDEFTLQEEFGPIVGTPERPTMCGFLFRNEGRNTDPHP